MKKYVLVPLDRYQALKTPSAYPTATTSPQPHPTVASTIPPGHLATEDQAEPQSASDRHLHRPEAEQHSQQVVNQEQEGPQPKRKKTQPKKKKQNELSSGATAGRPRQFWLKP